MGSFLNLIKFLNSLLICGVTTEAPNGISGIQYGSPFKDYSPSPSNLFIHHSSIQDTRCKVWEWFALL